MNLMNKLYIFDLNIKMSPYEWKIFMDFLPEYKKEKINKFKNKKIKIQKILSYILPLYISEIFLGAKTSIYYGSKGKPFLCSVEELHFNLSNTDNVIVTVFSSDNIGIDAEELITDNFEDIYNFILTTKEREYINNLKPIISKEKALTKIWCMKESYIKKSENNYTQEFQSINMVENFNLVDRYRYDEFKVFELNYNTTCVICTNKDEKYLVEDLKYTDIFEYVKNKLL